MIDIHAHILPGVDDGAEDLYETLEMARMAAEIGVTAMVATPHCNIPGGFDNYYGEEYLHIFQKASEAIRREGIPLTLLPGMEVFATFDLPSLLAEGKILTLNQSRYLLLEFEFDEDPDYAMALLERLREMGIIPVIAHAERYRFIQENLMIAWQCRRLGYLIQVNKGSFLGRFGLRARTAAYQLMDQELISVVASDAHSSRRRTPFLLDAYEELLAEYPREKVDALFTANPRKICRGMPVNTKI